MYRKSDRRYEEAPPPYGAGYHVRRVCSRGCIKWQGRAIFVTTAIAGHDVGLRLVSNHQYELWLYHVLMGTIDTQACAFQVAPSRDLERARLSA